ncbi:MAG: SusC/RagA family TonB-linked outer membrane protein [Chitinophagaceae bacterium]|nr:SusC/RagA family TonB-linked outer membrane protein [Chitinophagaceae bacterium]
MQLTKTPPGLAEFYLPAGRRQRIGGNQMLLVVKLVTIFMLAAVMQVSASGTAQTITYSATNVSITKVLSVVEDQTGYAVFYRKQDLKNTAPVSVSLNKADLKTALTILLKDQPLEFQIEENTVFIRPKTIPEESAPKLEINATPIKGVIRDAEGNPLGGINIVIKGTKRGVVSDAYGNFMIDAKEGEVLIISSVSYAAREIKIGASDAPIIVSLEKNISQLDEVQYIAYGTQTKRYSVGNVSSVKGTDIEKQPVQNPLFALQGRVPGLLVTQNTGLANGAFTVRIQGQNSISKGNDPLIVIDGVPLAVEMFKGIAPGPLSAGTDKDGNSPINFINPADIEAIDVLKDADATAIYGSRAANGAILITTKKGKAGKTKASVGLQEGWGKIAHKVDMLNTRQYLDMRYEAIRNDGLTINSSPNYDLLLWDTTRYTDWQKELIGGTARYTNATASISGGSSTMQYLIGGTLCRTTTVFPGNQASKTGAVHFNINGASVNQRFKLSLTGSYFINDNGVPGEDLTRYALFLVPNAPPLYNSDSTLNWAPNASGSSTRDNPMKFTQFNNYDHSAKSLTSNAVISYSIVPGLTASSSFGYNNIQGNTFYGISDNAYPPEARANTARASTFSNTNSFSWIAEPQITFTRARGKTFINALVGSTFQKSFGEYTFINARGFVNDLLIRDLLSATFIDGGYGNTIYRYNALFGRINLIHDKKYIVNLTARRDGSSRFGENNLFNNFWSAAAGWVFTEEKNIGKALHFLSFGKLRASYGTTGNDGIGDYLYLNKYSGTFSDITYQGTMGLWTNEIANPYLQWEETNKLMAGVDLGFFGDRAIFNLTFSRNRSSNQLLGYPLSSITGVTGFTQNLPAIVQNTSWEFSLMTNNIKDKNLIWTTNINLTVPRNKVISFPGIEETSYGSGRGGVIVGQPLGIMPYYHYLGVDPGSGRYLLANENKQPVFAFGDQVGGRDILISTQPDFYGGLVNTISYRGFSLDFLFEFRRQKGLKALYFWNESDLPGAILFGELSNQPVTVLNRWQSPGNAKPIQRFTTAFGAPSVTQTDAYYSWDASYIRLKNVSLSWQIPTNWSEKMHLQSGTVYFRGQNLATISQYTGLDPETQNSKTLPPLQLWTTGITIVF